MGKTKLCIGVTILSLVMLLAGASCVPAEQPPISPDEEIPSRASGTVEVRVTDAPPRDEVTGVLVSVSKVEIHQAVAEQEQQQQGEGEQVLEQQQIQESEGEWLILDIIEGANPFDLLQIKGIEEFLAVSEVGVGKYTQIRLTIDKVEVTLGDGDPQEATVPSGTLKFVRPFDVLAGETTILLVDFDADKSVNITGDGKIIVRPVVKLTVRQEEETGPSQDLEVGDAVEAQDTVLTYLRENYAQDAPGEDIEWQEEDVTPPGWVGGVFKEFTSDDWTVKVSYAVLPPKNTVYQVTVFSTKLGWYWEGSVKANGSLKEVSAFRQMSEEESQRTAEEFLRNSPTFVFDGIEDTLTLVNTITAEDSYYWVFIFEFVSRNDGYGDRTGQTLLEVETPHQAVIAVEQLEIISAVMDEQWDMLNQEMIE